MRSIHIIAQLAGFSKWTDMSKASEVKLELAKLLFDNSHKLGISPKSWGINKKVFVIQKI